MGGGTLYETKVGVKEKKRKQTKTPNPKLSMSQKRGVTGGEGEVNEDCTMTS